MQRLMEMFNAELDELARMIAERKGYVKPDKPTVTLEVVYEKVSEVQDSEGKAQEQK